VLIARSTKIRDVNIIDLIEGLSMGYLNQGKITLLAFILIKKEAKKGNILSLYISIPFWRNNKKLLPRVFVVNLTSSNRNDQFCRHQIGKWKLLLPLGLMRTVWARSTPIWDMGRE